MPAHRDWTRRGVGRALLWWPFTAFLLAAAFPALAVPAVAGSGVLLVLVGLVGGALGRWWRAHRLRSAGRTIGAAPGAVADAAGATPATGAVPAAAAVPDDGPREPAHSPDPAPTDEPDDPGPQVRAA